jgi:hypothetical protein
LGTLARLPKLRYGNESLLFVPEIIDIYPDTALLRGGGFFFAGDYFAKVEQVFRAERPPRFQFVSKLKRSELVHEVHGFPIVPCVKASKSGVGAVCAV